MGAPFPAPDGAQLEAMRAAGLEIVECQRALAKGGLNIVGELLRGAGTFDVFRVKNATVPYELGFWLRRDSLLDRARLPSVSGGGLTTGKTQDYAIELKPGNYVYSCPLNPTPDYKLVVRS